jgi:Fe-S-cluster containining protein
MSSSEVIARCSIYERRPDVCRKYPTVSHYTPPECTFHFSGGERRGECACDQGACCAIPREHGEPGGVPMPEEAGGTPCKYLVYEEREAEEKEKTAASVYDGYQQLAEAIGYGQ